MTTPASVYPLGKLEKYDGYVNAPNTIELTASFDVFLAPSNTSQGGVKGALDKLCINQLQAGIYQVFIQDVYTTEPYPYFAAQPITINTLKTSESFNSQKILHAQVSLSNWNASAGTPTSHAAWVWWWCPSTFPAQMAPADASIQNSLLVMVYNTETGALEDVAGMRAHLQVTVVDTFDNANFYPGVTNLETPNGY